MPAYYIIRILEYVYIFNNPQQYLFESNRLYLIEYKSTFIYIQLKYNLLHIDTKR